MKIWRDSAVIWRSSFIWHAGVQKRISKFRFQQINWQSFVYILWKFGEIGISDPGVLGERSCTTRPVSIIVTTLIIVHLCSLWAVFDLSGGGWGGLAPHWLKMTPILVTENFCLRGSASTYQSWSSITVCLCCFSLQHQFVAKIVSSFWDLWVEFMSFVFCCRITRPNIQS